MKFLSLILAFCFCIGALVAKPQRLRLDDAATNVRQSVQQWDAQAEQRTNVLREASGMAVVTPGDIYREARRLVDAGDERGDATVGLLLYFGFGVETNRLEASSWLQSAADRGVAIAQVFLGRMLMSGEAGRTNWAEARQMFQRAADQDAPAGQFHLGVMHHFGQGMPTNYDAARRYYELADAKHFAPATCGLGTIYDLGQGVRRDQQRALELFRKAAAQSYPLAVFNVGVSYARGEGTGKDLAEATRWYQRAAVLGSAPAQHNYANALLAGRGVQRDHEEAARWFRLAGNAGILESKAALAFMILDRNIKGDVQEAIASLRESAENGNLLSAALLGGLYAGLDPSWEKDFPANPKEALPFLEPAAEAGHLLAQHALGLMHLRGIGTHKNDAAAYKWFTLAARSGASAAATELKALSRRISPADMAEGLRQVAAFKPRGHRNPDGETFLPGR